VEVERSAEAIRIVKTNLEFMLSTVSEGRAKTILVTSTIPKEGKTFISVNLAATFALTGKKSIAYWYGY
jgi:Mrp family chromosome partitioning ATPase